MKPGIGPMTHTDSHFLHFGSWVNVIDWKAVVHTFILQKLSMDKALALGAFNFIKKPIDLTKMQQILNKINELDN